MFKDLASFQVVTTQRDGTEFRSNFFIKEDAERLANEMKDNGIDFLGVISRLDLCPKKPRGAGTAGKFGGDKQEMLPIGVPRKQAPKAGAPK